MKKTVSLLYFIVGLSGYLSGQNEIFSGFVALFDKQLEVFPQEKIYLHTDKPYYISGETIWFRAHLVDATTHTPALMSRYVYVELINPLDSIVSRVKVRQTDSIYCSNIPISDDLPEGDYVLRAYTNFMGNLEEEYRYAKSIRIGTPHTQSIRTDTRFEFISDKTMAVEFRFSHPRQASAVVPRRITIRINGGGKMDLKSEGNTTSINFNLPAESLKRVLQLEIEADGRIYSQFISIPIPDSEFDVTFYPEGGSLLEGVTGRVAFKAMRSNGKSAEITGTVYDNTGKEVTDIKSDFRGMGSFMSTPEEGKTYYAECTNGKGASKRFDLPVAIKNGYSLASNWLKGRLFVSVLKSDNKLPRQDTLYLLAHTRGVVYFADTWPYDEEYISFSVDDFPSGVLHLLLLDATMQPLSERLVFVNNGENKAKVDFGTDKSNYPGRSLAKNRVTIVDEDNNPLTGSFSVSVTDDQNVVVDTCSNIMTSLLLTSDLRGYIEDPGLYFLESQTSEWALELLMLTQGWRRYDIPAIISGEFSYPTIMPEMASEISGTVQSVMSGRPAEGIDVNLLAPRYGYFDQTQTDIDGRFYFRDFELPDSTEIIIYVDPKHRSRRMRLITDSEIFPKRTLSFMMSEAINREIFAKYAEKVEQKYVSENGERVINLEEITITASQKPILSSAYYPDTQTSNIITEEQLEKAYSTDIYTLLGQFMDVNYSSKGVGGGREDPTKRELTIRGTTVVGGTVGEGAASVQPPLLIVDDFPMNIDYLGEISVSEIAQIEVLKSAAHMARFGVRGASGVIVIYTKQGKSIPPSPDHQFNLSTLSPLGYRQAVEFYAPKYDTPAAKANAMPDLRTTIHWEPDVRTDSTGVALFDFYTADSETTYTVIIEGVTSDGRVVRKEGKINRSAR